MNYSHIAWSQGKLEAQSLLNHFDDFEQFICFERWNEDPNRGPFFLIKELLVYLKNKQTAAEKDVDKSC